VKRKSFRIAGACCPRHWGQRSDFPPRTIETGADVASSKLQRHASPEAPLLVPESVRIGDTVSYLGRSAIYHAHLPSPGGLPGDAAGARYIKAIGERPRWFHEQVVSGRSFFFFFCFFFLADIKELPRLRGLLRVLKSNPSGINALAASG